MIQSQAKASDGSQNKQTDYRARNSSTSQPAKPETEQCSPKRNCHGQFERPGMLFDDKAGACTKGATEDRTTESQYQPLFHRPTRCEDRSEQPRDSAGNGQHPEESVGCV